MSAVRRIVGGFVAVGLLAAAGVTVAVAQTVAAPARTTPSALPATTTIPPLTSTFAVPTTDAPTTVAPTTSAPATTAAPPTTSPPTTSTATAQAAPPGTDLGLAGCPVPPKPPGPPPPPPWHPSVLVPESSLPPEAAPAPWTSDTRAIEGKGMWVYEWNETESGNAQAIVDRAVRAGLSQIWLRVGDSPDGFYGAAELDALVPLAHAAGISVIGWGFPYLYDPLGDAAWTKAILDWRSPSGQRVDGYSADIERSTEGVALTEHRVAAYLGAVRQAAGNQLIVATVYPPLDAYWDNSVYPYAAIARYVDAFAPMIYWECTDPGSDAVSAIRRLGTLRPVHLIGQAFSLASDGGRVPSPSAAELQEFMTDGHAAGAIGASFYSWQAATPDEWAAVTAYRW
jgi:hypothetical protein